MAKKKNAADDPFGATGQDDPFSETEAVESDAAAAADPYSMSDVFSGMDGEEQPSGQDAWGEEPTVAEKRPSFDKADTVGAGGDDDPFAGVWGEGQGDGGDTQATETEGDVGGDEAPVDTSTTEQFNRNDVFSSADTGSLAPEDVFGGEEHAPAEDDGFGSVVEEPSGETDEADPFADTDAYAGGEEAATEETEAEGDLWGDDAAATEEGAGDESQLDAGSTVDAGDADEFWADQQGRETEAEGGFDDAGGEEGTDDEFAGGGFDDGSGFSGEQPAGEDDTGLYDADFDFMAGSTARRMREKISQREDDVKRVRPSSAPSKLPKLVGIVLLAGGGVFGWYAYKNKQAATTAVDPNTTAVTTTQNPTDVKPVEVVTEKLLPLGPAGTTRGKVQRSINYGVKLYEGQ